MSERRSLSGRVRSGLIAFASLAEASSPAMLFGINEENSKLTKEERKTLDEVEAAIAWINYIATKKAARPRAKAVSA